MCAPKTGQTHRSTPTQTLSVKYLSVFCAYPLPEFGEAYAGSESSVILD